MNDLTNIKWKKDVMPIIKERIELFKTYGLIPSLKTIFYSLVLLNILPNSHNYYRYLIKYTKNARISGELPIDCFPEQNLPRISNPGENLDSAKSYVQRIVKYLEYVSSPNSIYKYQFNNNAYKPFPIIEIWLENKSLAYTFDNLLRNYGINIISNQGFNIPRFINKNLYRLKQSMNDENKYIRYFGNFDLFSDNIDNIIKYNTQTLKLNIDFKKIAITEDQMRKYLLPENPNPTITRTLDNNPRKNFYVSKY
ncbi:MAG TPA: hypothetical protein VJ697_13400, partial [Nitrososphaeraceae archaeon]|nr:hypothetical protein [Nitrososphaeraceae archaeon]